MQVAVCTPGRIIDLLKMKACSMFRATFLVFDEADRMFDMGFEPQVGCISVWPKSSYPTKSRPAICVQLPQKP